MISFACKEIHTATEGFACILRSHSLRRLSLDCFFEKTTTTTATTTKKKKKRTHCISNIWKNWAETDVVSNRVTISVIMRNTEVV